MGSVARAETVGKYNLHRKRLYLRSLIRNLANSRIHIAGICSLRLLDLDKAEIEPGDKRFGVLSVS